MEDLVHSSNYWPRIFPYNGDVAPSQIDRVQNITPDVTLNRKKVEEVGSEGVIGYIKAIPTIAYKLTAKESGNFGFWRKITNQADSVNTISLSDFKTSAFDTAGYIEDDGGVVVGTTHYPMLRTAGFSLTIGDPKAEIEKSFDLVGETAHIWLNDNKYLVYNRHEATSNSDGDIDLSSKPPVADPDNGNYIIRVLRVRGVNTTKLVYGVDYTYSNTTKILTIVSIQTADVIKSYYTSSVAPDEIFTTNIIDPVSTLADSVSIYLYVPATGKPDSSDYVSMLQNISMNVTFDRNDVNALGSRIVQKRGVKDSTVNFTLGKTLERYTIEQVLRGVASSYGKIDVEKFTSQAAIIIKIYEDYTKTTFKYGFRSIGLSSETVKGGPGINAYIENTHTLVGENLTITTSEVELGI